MRTGSEVTVLEVQTTFASWVAVVLIVAAALLILVLRHLIKVDRRRAEYVRQLDLPPEPKRGSESYQDWEEKYEYRDFHHQHEPEQVWEKVKVKGKRGGKR